MAERRKSAKGRKLGSSRRANRQHKQFEGGFAAGLPEDPPHHGSDITEKLQEFFRDCDKEGKGFITRNDMQELEGNFPLSAEELMLVFDKLDTDKNGCLTQEEFTAAIKECLPAQTTAKEQGEKRNTSEKLYESHGFVPLEEADEEEKQYFMSLMDNLGADNIFEDQSEIWKLWNQLRQDEPHLLGNLEEFLAKVTSEIRQAKKEKEKLEMTLKKRIVEHNKEVQQLYEEMEQQITKEKERLHSENYMTRKVLSKELKKELDIKKDEVQHLIGVQTELETQLSTMHSEQQETSTENQKLKRTNQELESQLEKIREQLQEAQVRLQVMRETTTQNKEDEKESDNSEAIGQLCSPDEIQTNPIVNEQEIVKPKSMIQQRSESVISTYVSDEMPQAILKGPPQMPLETTESDSVPRNRVISIEEEPLPELMNETHRIFKKEVTSHEEKETEKTEELSKCIKQENGSFHQKTQEYKTKIHTAEEVEENPPKQGTTEECGLLQEEVTTHKGKETEGIEIEKIPLPKCIKDENGIFHQKVQEHNEKKMHTAEELKEKTLKECTEENHGIFPKEVSEHEENAAKTTEVVGEKSPKQCIIEDRGILHPQISEYNQKEKQTAEVEKPLLSLSENHGIFHQRVQEEKEKEKHTTEGLDEETLKEGTKEDHGVFQREASEYKENETKTIGVDEGSSNQYTNENSGIPPKATPEHEPNKVQITEVEEPLRSLSENHGIFHQRVQEDKEKEKHTTEGLGEETLKEGTKEDHGVFQREVSEYKENETKTIGVEEGSSNQYTNENSGIPPKETPEHEPNKVQVTEVEEPLRSLRENHGIFHQEVPKYKEEKTHTLEEEQNQEKLQEQGNKISDRTDETASLMKDTKETPQLSHDQEELPHNPDHIFNVMFVGNSDVGKTSFIRRFHQNQFFSGLGATVGVDFQVKTLTVDDKCFALRLWDTAGQERFHSVTRQFFRKADGVVIMYDITSEQSFIAVRFWLDCIQEEVGDGVALLLLGNKADCAADRKISTETGQQLAKEYSLLFYECSAASEFNITEPMVHLIRLLREQEKKIKEKVLELASQPQKARGCCA
ncbi:EF-hand calcium-binding domain-containing protein 4B [Latimeria chalumnae]|uniref:EF-hand calcium-binding domain-containing protein 4B n=1 Tax=Latimeria chalumnae TaxID=7897 RepID=UPI0006D92F7B|nr:PREDICTED: ras-related protein Rab-44 [Latimeria chalumnae]|eukprot:XP_005987646.2 PREDICTED: ras-related protein Rab-44 [Latimeria chalumnae]